MLDIFYLTYKFDFSEDNFEQLKKLAGKGQRVINVADIDGIYNGHKECAKQSQTKHFFVVDGDAWVLDDFDFSYVPSETDEVYPETCSAQCTHVWRARNPATGQVYGYGGVKLFARDAFMDKAFLNIENGPLVDVTTEVAKRGYPYLPISDVSNETRFADTPFNAWKSAFRETTKLASGVATENRKQRLEEWKNPLKDVAYRNEIKLGAIMGENFGTVNAHDHGILFRINNWKWLRDWFKERRSWKPEPVRENVLDFSDGRYLMSGVELLMDYIKHPNIEDFRYIRKAIINQDEEVIYKTIKEFIFNNKISAETMKASLRFLWSGIDNKFNPERAIHFLYENYDEDSPVPLFGVMIGAIVNTKQLDINYVDALSYYQVESKTWMFEKLKDVIETKRDGDSFGRTCILGGWIGLSSYMMQQLHLVKYANNVDLDENAIAFSKELNNYNHHDSTIDNASMYDTSEYELVVNTSSEHMDNTWFDNLKLGQWVVIQNNDFHDIPEHINTVKDLDDMIDRYKLSKLVFAGVRDCDRYNRFMIIGQK